MARARRRSRSSAPPAGRTAFRAVRRRRFRGRGHDRSGPCPPAPAAARSARRARPGRSPPGGARRNGREPAPGPASRRLPRPIRNCRAGPASPPATPRPAAVRRSRSPCGSRRRAPSRDRRSGPRRAGRGGWCRRRRTAAPAAGTSRGRSAQTAATSIGSALTQRPFNAASTPGGTLSTDSIAARPYSRSRSSSPPSATTCSWWASAWAFCFGPQISSREFPTEARKATASAAAIARLSARRRGGQGIARATAIRTAKLAPRPRLWRRKTSRRTK